MDLKLAHPTQPLNLYNLQCVFKQNIVWQGQGLCGLYSFINTDIILVKVVILLLWQCRTIPQILPIEAAHKRFFLVAAEYLIQSNLKYSLCVLQPLGHYHSNKKDGKFIYHIKGQRQDEDEMKLR